MRTSRLVVGLLVLFLSTGTLPARAAQPCAPGIGIGLLQVPANAVDPRARTYVVDHVAPGTRFSRTFEICNGTGADVRVALYAGAAEVRNGTFALKSGRSVNELTGWIRIKPASLALAPGARARAQATFDVPATATAGERYAVLLADLPPAARTTGVPVGSRVGIRVYLDVGPGGAPRSDFLVDSLRASRSAVGQAQVTAQVHNTGGRALDVTGELALLDGPGGLSGGPYAARLGTTLPIGDTGSIVMPVDGAVSAGPWRARVTLRAAGVERQFEASLTFPDRPGASGPTSPAQRRMQGGSELDRHRLAALLLIPLLTASAFVVNAVRRRGSGPPS